MQCETTASPGAKRKGRVGTVVVRSVDAITPSPENELLYRPVDTSDPEVMALASSIREHGVQEPIVITEDGFILSGHRRHAAARLAGLSEVPCRVHRIRRGTDHDEFLRLLREFNRQRVKGFDEKLREAVATANPEEAYEALIGHRQAASRVEVETIELRQWRPRKRISEAKRLFLEAVNQVIQDRRRFWPLSDRQVHYALLNNPPLRHASKPDSRYGNNPESYKDLTDLLTRGRLAGQIPMEAIADETRPYIQWRTHRDVQAFLEAQLNDFLKGYWRDLMVSQPNHIEIVAEKLTVRSILEPVAARYCIPMTIGRGFSSLDPRRQMVQRFQASGKQRLVILFLSDLDPDGVAIPETFARSLRDDFGVDGVEPVRVALTSEQVQEFNLPAMLKAKASSPNYQRFVDRYGSDAFELEAAEPETLQAILSRAIDAVLDVEAFNHEVDQEKLDAASLEATRKCVQDLMWEANIDIGE